MNGQHEWSESGEQLLTHFEVLIRGYGGAEILARRIENECIEFFGGVPSQKTRDYSEQNTIHISRYREFTPVDDDYIIEHWHTHTSQVMGDHLRCSKYVIRRRGRQLGFLSKPMLHNKRPALRKEDIAA